MVCKSIAFPLETEGFPLEISPIPVTKANPKL
jgi:hypothetical protein